MKALTKSITILVISLALASLAVSAYGVEGKININTASKQELMTLKYVGDATAEKIMEYRKAHTFEVPKDIMKVKGVGQKTFEVNKDRICCSG